MSFNKVSYCKMSNWYNEYRLKFHIEFTHYDKRTESIYNELIIEAKTPELAKKIIIYEYNHSKKLLTNIPRGWYGNILKKNLVIDEVKLIWKYQTKVI